MSNASSKTGNKAGGKQSSKESSARSGWSPAAAIALVLFGFLVLPQFTQVLLTMTLLFVAGWSTDHINDWFGLPIATFLYVLLVECMTIAILVWFIRRRKRALPKSVGMQRRPSWQDAGYMIGGILVYFGLFIATILVLDQVAPVNTEQEQAVGFEPTIAGVDVWLAFASLVVLPPIAEEIIFRGFLFGTLRGHRLSLPWSVVITSLLFATLHLFGSADGGLLWIAFIDTFVLSVVLCYVRDKTGAIWACIGIHALKNGIVFLNRFVF
jgi:membrane protease YdiL (CAAX protease family)